MSKSARSTKSLVAQNTFTDAIYVRNGDKATLTIVGTYAGTITMQTRLKGTSVWLDVDDATADTAGRWDCNGGGDDWRAGFKTGNYTSGTAVVTVQGTKAITN